MTMQFVPTLPRPPRRSGRVLPEEDGIALQWEKVSDIAKDLPPLFREHWREIALFRDSVPLEPNWDLYFQYEILGMLHVLTVRADGLLVGYVFLILTPHLHYASTIYAHCDMFWLKPAFRRGLLGYQMLKQAVGRAAERQAKVMYVSTKRHFLGNRVGKLLERLGFSAEETVYYKQLR